MIDRWKIVGHFTFLRENSAYLFVPFHKRKSSLLIFHQIWPWAKHAGRYKISSAQGYFLFILSRHVALSLGIENPSQRACWAAQRRDASTQRVKIKEMPMPKGADDAAPWGSHALSPATITRTNKLTVKATWIKSRFSPKNIKRTCNRIYGCEICRPRAHVPRPTILMRKLLKIIIGECVGAIHWHCSSRDSL